MLGIRCHRDRNGMDTTSNLNLPFIAAAQAQKHVTHNESLRVLDAVVQLMVLDKDLVAPPGSPAEGERFIVGPASSGAWTGQTDKVAAWQDGAWAFYTPRTGWLAWAADEGRLYAWSGSGWSALPAGSLDNVVEDAAPQLGGDLDANGHNIGFDDGTGLTDDAGNGQVVFHTTASAVNRIGITNAAAGSAPQIAAEGADANIDLRLAPKGTGIVRSAAQFAVSAGTYPPLRTERTTAGTSNTVGVSQFLATSSGNIIDGFAVNHDFAIQDNSATINTIGSIQFARSGADNSGRFRVLPTNSGSQAAQFEIAPAGNPYFPSVATTASASNAVLNNASSPANELLRSTSSIRYKSVVENIDPCYADNALKLRPVWYRSKCPADDPTWSWYGLVAEEVAAIEPRLVCWGYGTDGKTIVEREEDGRVVRETTFKRGAHLVPDGVAYNRLVVLLLSIVKRQETRIRDLEVKSN
jgi:hypothetical protein